MNWFNWGSSTAREATINDLEALHHEPEGNSGSAPGLFGRMKSTVAGAVNRVTSAPEKVRESYDYLIYFVVSVIVGMLLISLSFVYLPLLVIKP